MLPKYTTLLYLYFDISSYFLILTASSNPEVILIFEISRLPPCK